MTLLLICPRPPPTFGKGGGKRQDSSESPKPRLAGPPGAHPQLQGRKLPLGLPLGALRRPAPDPWAPPRSPAAALWRLRLSRAGSGRALGPREDSGIAHTPLGAEGSSDCGAHPSRQTALFLPEEEVPAAPRLTEQLAKLVSSGQGSRQGPRGLRHHSCSAVGPFAVLFGGETLTRARDTICNDLYVYDTRESTFKDW